MLTHSSPGEGEPLSLQSPIRQSRRIVMLNSISALEKFASESLGKNLDEIDTR